MELDRIYNSDGVNGVNELGFGNICIVTDPPYNLGYHYDEYNDSLNEDAYNAMMKRVIGDNMAVILHYPEAICKLCIAINRAPERVVSWVYNSNTPRQHRDIAFFGVKPDFSRVSQPYKNPTDKRIKARIEAGKTCKMYDWFEHDQIKNVEKEKLLLDHPCIIPLEVMDKVIKLIPEDLIIVDPFCGSGTTLVAAKKNKRKFVGFEISKKYFEMAKRRMNEETAQIELF